MGKRRPLTSYKTTLKYMENGELVTEVGEIKVGRPLVAFTKKLKTLSGRGIDVLTFVIEYDEKIENGIKSAAYQNSNGENAIILDNTKCQKIIYSMTDDFLNLDKRVEALGYMHKEYAAKKSYTCNYKRFHVGDCEKEKRVIPYGYRVVGTSINTKIMKSKDMIYNDDICFDTDDPIKALKAFADERKEYRNEFSSECNKIIKVVKQAECEEDEKEEVAIYNYQDDVGPKLILNPNDEADKIVARFKVGNHMKDTVEGSKDVEDFKSNISMDSSVAIRGNLGLDYSEDKSEQADEKNEVVIGTEEIEVEIKK